MEPTLALLVAKLNAVGPSQGREAWQVVVAEGRGKWPPETGRSAFAVPSAWY
jgi:hypothetical protein